MDTLKTVMEINTKGKNKKILKKYTKVWNEVKNQIETINGDKPIKYQKDFMKFGLESDDSLPLGKIINIPSMTIVVEPVSRRQQIFSASLFPRMQVSICKQIIKSMQFLYNILTIISHLFMIKHKHLLSMIFKKDNKRTLIYYTYKWEASNRLTKKSNRFLF